MFKKISLSFLVWLLKAIDIDVDFDDGALLLKLVFGPWTVLDLEIDLVKRLSPVSSKGEAHPATVAVSGINDKMSVDRMVVRLNKKGERV